MKLKKPSKKKNIQFEIDLNIQPIIGVDEVGRGCIAGPVCAGVVIFREENLRPESLKTYVDSKTLPETKRQAICEEIKNSHHWALGWATVEEIDQINIRQASLLAMCRAVMELGKTVDLSSGQLLIDGRDILTGLIPKFGSLLQRAVISGDSLVRQISAASILAKVARDDLMTKIADDYPEYGFITHKGYGTEAHREAIQKYGVLNCHRKTFAGVKEHIR